MSEENEDHTAHITADELEAVAEEIPTLVLASVHGNLQQEQERRAREGEPLLPPITDNEIAAIEYGAQQAVILLLRALYSAAEDQEEQK